MNLFSMVQTDEKFRDDDSKRGKISLLGHRIEDSFFSSKEEEQEDIENANASIGDPKHEDSNYKLQDPNE